MRRFLTVIFILTCLCSKSRAQLGYSPTGDKSKIILTAKLGIPFGTIAKLDAEIYDGDRLQMKVYEDVYLLKINSVNGKRIQGKVLLTFTDETGTLANDVFGLYKRIHKKEADSLETLQVNKMKQKYVGKKLTIMAYEIGHFRGIPKNYFNYRPIKSDVFFCFENYLVVVANLTK